MPNTGPDGAEETTKRCVERNAKELLDLLKMYQNTDGSVTIISGEMTPLLIRSMALVQAMNIHLRG